MLPCFTSHPAWRPHLASSRVQKERQATFSFGDYSGHRARRPAGLQRRRLASVSDHVLASYSFCDRCHRHSDFLREQRDERTGASCAPGCSWRERFFLQEADQASEPVHKLASGIKPKSCLERVLLLVTHLLPDASPEEIHAIMMQRLPAVPQSSAFEDALDSVDGIMASSDKKELVDLGERRSKSKLVYDIMMAKIGPGSSYIQGFVETVHKKKKSTT